MKPGYKPIINVHQLQKFVRSYPKARIKDPELLMLIKHEQEYVRRPIISLEDSHYWAQLVTNSLQLQGKDSLNEHWVAKQRLLFFKLFIKFANSKGINITNPRNINEQDLEPFKKIFVTKATSFLCFQIKEAISSLSIAKDQWTSEDCALFTKVMRYSKDKRQGKLRCVHWKKIAYELYKLSTSGHYHSGNDCRQKWINHLDPNLSKDSWSLSQDFLLFQLLLNNGPRWSLIAKKMTYGRNENQVKNRAISLLRKCYRKSLKKFEARHFEKVLEYLQMRKMAIQVSKITSYPAVQQEQNLPEDNKEGVLPDQIEIKPWRQSFQLSGMGFKLTFMRNDQNEDWSYGQNYIQQEVLSIPISLVLDHLQDS